MTATRGTTNRNDRGSSETRRRRREWLVQTYRANVDAFVVDGLVLDPAPLWLEGSWQPACRCYRCGILLIVATVTVDRIIPGCDGGRYVRTNIRPACGRCNSETGGALRRKRRKR